MWQESQRLWKVHSAVLDTHIFPQMSYLYCFLVASHRQHRQSVIGLGIEVVMVVLAAPIVDIITTFMLVL
jgi:hypothetical protein